ncbi:HD domain-containing protein [Paucilactobacillus kaifaensis]|uniref:HD domain-containing protein n=1 Tax=Paucilactobacillus kaifaensis TaxID=2559921 RepID=UPI0010F87885|nr:HD domain-containing protein [Paucilactobacillus kaifaensis]
MQREQTEQLQQIKQFVQLEEGKDKSGHGMDHLSRVTKMVEQICQTEPADLFIALIAAWLHDVIDDKLTDDPNGQQDKVIKFLQDIGLRQAQIDAVMLIIKNMSFAKSLDGKAKTLSIEGQIVQDADRLDAIGALGIARAFYYSGHTGEDIYDPQKKPRLNMTKEQYRHEPGTAINHFYEKLLLLAPQLNTVTAKKIGEKRQQVMQTFLAEFKAEWNGTTESGQ